MPDSKIYLKQFLKDVKEMEPGIQTDHEKLTVKLTVLLRFPSPCSTHIKSIVSHSGYDACERCAQHGEHHTTVQWYFWKHLGSVELMNRLLQEVNLAIIRVLHSLKI